MRIVVVEDEPDIATVLAYNLRQAGFDPVVAENGAIGLRLVRDLRPSLVLLDLMLPDVGGMEVCRRIKADPATADIPVLMLTARGEESDRVNGLEAGADDYVTKPFSVREVILRVRAILRRKTGTDGSAPQAEERWGALRVDRAGYRVTVEEQPVELTATEFRLLIDLIDAGGRVRTRDALLDRVWGYAPEVVSRTVDTHVRRLREKMGVAGDLIETVRGVGYRFRATGGATS